MIMAATAERSPIKIWKKLKIPMESIMFERICLFSTWAISWAKTPKTSSILSAFKISPLLSTI